MTKSKTNLPPVGWRIALSIIFIIGIYIMGTMVALRFFGEETAAVLDGADSAYDDRRGDKDLMYRVTVSYHFYASGKEYHNSVVYKGGETLTKAVGNASPRTVNIRYLKAFPYINNLEGRVSFDGKLDLIYSLMAVVFLSFMLCLINGIGSNRRNPGSSSGRQTHAKAPGRRITMAQLMENWHIDYDELVEEYYAKGWDRDDPSWKCSCGHWSDSLFCKSCGRKNAQ